MSSSVHFLTPSTIGFLVAVWLFHEGASVSIGLVNQESASVKVDGQVANHR